MTVPFAPRRLHRSKSPRGMCTNIDHKLEAISKNVYANSIFPLFDIFIYVPSPIIMGAHLWPIFGKFFFQSLSLFMEKKTPILYGIDKHIRSLNIKYATHDPMTENVHMANSPHRPPCPTEINNIHFITFSRYFESTNNMLGERVLPLSFPEKKNIDDIKVCSFL